LEIGPLFPRPLRLNIDSFADSFIRPRVNLRSVCLPLEVTRAGPFLLGAEKSTEGTWKAFSRLFFEVRPFAKEKTPILKTPPERRTGAPSHSRSFPKISEISLFFFFFCFCEERFHLYRKSSAPSPLLCKFNELLRGTLPSDLFFSFQA